MDEGEGGSQGPNGLGKGSSNLCGAPFGPTGKLDLSPFPTATRSTTLPDKRRRRWDAIVEDDPLAGLINLFDLWMVFSIAVVILGRLSEKSAAGQLRPVAGRRGAFAGGS